MDEAHFIAQIFKSYTCYVQYQNQRIDYLSLSEQTKNDLSPDPPYPKGMKSLANDVTVHITEYPTDWFSHLLVFKTSHVALLAIVYLTQPSD